MQQFSACMRAWRREEMEQADGEEFSSKASVHKWLQNVIMGSKLPSCWLASDLPGSMLNS